MSVAIESTKALAASIDPSKKERQAAVDAAKGGDLFGAGMIASLGYSLRKATAEALENAAKEAEKQAELEDEEKLRRQAAENQGFKPEKKEGLADLGEGENPKLAKEREGKRRSAEFANNIDIEQSYALANKLSGDIAMDLQLKDPNQTLEEHYAGKGQKKKKPFGKDMPSDDELRQLMARRLNDPLENSSIA